MTDRKKLHPGWLLTSVVTALVGCTFALPEIALAASSAKAAKASKKAPAAKKSKAAAKAKPGEAKASEGKLGEQKAETAKTAPASEPSKAEQGKLEQGKTAPGVGAETPQQVADAIQHFYEKQPGFRANFTQVVTKKGLSVGLKRDGSAWLKKGDPGKDQQGKMRWDYPAEEIFYFCNGEVLWSYERRERLAVKVPVKNSQVYQATQYLVGQGNLGRDFTLELVPSTLPDAVALKMTPKQGTQTLRSLTLVVDKATHAVRASKLVDPVGDSTDLVWRDVRYEAAEDKLFEWTPPAGTTVKDLSKPK